jgi:putative tricarboxylic transport membrane protein
VAARPLELLQRIAGTSRTPRADVALALAVGAFAALLWREALKVPPPFFDPLGSAAVPKGVALVLLALSAMVLVRAVIARPWPSAGEDAGYRPRPAIAVGIVSLCLAYLGLMQLRLLGFQLASILFMIAATALLARLQLRTSLLGAAIALVVGIGGTLLFTRFFYIDLPR